MSVAEVLIDVMAPVALLVVLGAATGRRLGIEVSTLSRFSFAVLGPAFVFSILADAVLDGTVQGVVAAGNGHGHVWRVAYEDRRGKMTTDTLRWHELMAALCKMPPFRFDLCWCLCVSLVW